MKYLYQRSKLSLALLLLFTSILIFLTDRYILTSGFYEMNGDPFPVLSGQGNNAYEAFQKWVYLSSALYLLMKLFTVALILHSALYLSDDNVTFSSVFSIVVLAEYIFLIPAGIKLATFNYTYQHASLLDWHRYHVFSALSLFSDVPADWYYVLQSFNLFEIAYWFLLAYGISVISARNFDSSLRIIVCSYVPALFIWVAAVTFFTLMMFPATG